jgi:hypothetical protein
MTRLRDEGHISRLRWSDCRVEPPRHIPFTSPWLNTSIAAARVPHACITRGSSLISMISAVRPGTLAPSLSPPRRVVHPITRHRHHRISPRCPPVLFATPALHSLIHSLRLAYSRIRDGHPGRLEHCARRGKGEGRAARRRDRDPIAHPAARAREQTPEEPRPECL